MHYDTENDKFSSITGEWEIYPSDTRFEGTKEVELVEVGGNGYVTIPVGRIDEIIEGLRMAKRKAFNRQNPRPTAF